MTERLTANEVNSMDTDIYRAQTECLTHGKMLERCHPLDASCAVCVHGPECPRPCPEPGTP